MHFLIEIVEGTSPLAEKSPSLPVNKRPVKIAVSNWIIRDDLTLFRCVHWLNKE